MFGGLISSIFGGGFEVHADVDSPSTPGEKSVLTDPIEGIEPSAIIEAWEKYVRDKKIKIGPESNIDISDKDGGVFCHHQINIPALFGGGQFDMYYLYKFDAANGAISCTVYPSTVKLERKEATAISHFKLLQDPLRVEHWVENQETRLHGKVMKGFMETMLKALGATATAECDAKGLSDETKLAVVSAPIEGASIDADSFLDAFKQWKTTAKSATELPDGSLVEEISLDIDVLDVAPKTYSKQLINKEENCVLFEEYGTDEDLKTLVARGRLQVHKNPFRIEQYQEQVPQRMAGNDTMKMFKPVITGVLESLKPSS